MAEQLAVEVDVKNVTEQYTRTDKLIYLVRMKNFYIYSGIKKYNLLPNEIRNSTKNIFKVKCKMYCILKMDS